MPVVKVWDAATSSWVEVSGSASGGSGGAPTDATYVVTSSNATLTNERVLTAGSFVTVTDNGSSTVTVAVDATSANTASKVVARDGSGNFSVGTINGTAIPSSKTLVVTTDKLSVHAATSSSELAGVISDETGSGALVFATTPTLTTPVITQATSTPSFSSNTYTVTTGDEGKMLLASNSTTAGSVKIPTNATTAFAVGTQIHIIQTGTGQLTISAVTSGTTTVLSAGGTAASPKLRAQYSAATLLKTATDTWYVFGDIS